MRFIGLIFVIIVIGFMIGFMVLNSQQLVDIDIFGQKFYSVQVAMVCFFAFMAGMVFVLIFALADEIALRTTLHRMRKENKALHEELTALRNLPLKEEE